MTEIKLRLDDYNKIIKIEEQLDMLNGEYGNKDFYCIFCKSKLYNTKVGIVHHINCPIVHLRKFINKNNLKRTKK